MSKIKTSKKMLRSAYRDLGAGALDRAEIALHRVTEISQGQHHAEGLNGLGVVSIQRDRCDDAIGFFRQAVAIAPEYNYARENLVNALVIKGKIQIKEYKLEDASATLRAAHELVVSHDGSAVDDACRTDLGEALYGLGRLDEAVDVLEPAVRIIPRDLRVWTTLGCALNKTARFQEHLKFVEDILRLSQPLDDLSSIVMGLFENSEIDVLDEGILIPKIFRYMKQYKAVPVRNSAHSGRKRISIGYISRYLDKKIYLEFLDHILENHDRDKFVVNVYSDSHAIDPGGDIQGTQNLGNAELYERIRTDGVDILIDLNGFSSINRMGLLAMKPSPVIVSWFNVYSTLGLDTVDYLIGDDCVTPPDEDRHYSEKIYRLPGCYLLRSLDVNVPSVSEAPIARNGYCTFGSLASEHKTNVGTIEVWAAILDRVPDSRFILRNSEINYGVRRFYLDAFAKYGIDAARIHILGAASHAEFLETYDRIDIVLDSFPYNGGTTTVEALWQGVPVVTFRGERWVSRVTATIVNAIGHPEWVGRDRNDYVEIAVTLARNPQKLEEMRREQRRKVASSILCDAAGFTRKLETAYEHMIRETGVIP